MGQNAGSENQPPSSPRREKCDFAKGRKLYSRCQRRENVKPVSRAGKLVSVILNPVTLLDLHSLRPVVYKDVFSCSLSQIAPRFTKQQQQ